MPFLAHFEQVVAAGTLGDGIVDVTPHLRQGLDSCAALSGKLNASARCFDGPLDCALPDVATSYTRLLARACHSFYPIAAVRDEPVTQHMATEVDVLVDLMGHTRGGSFWCPCSA